MATQPTPPSAPPSGSITPEKLQHTFELGIWYTLALWPALHVAVQDNWGGPDSSDKRDWFAGAVSDLIIQRPETDHDDLLLFLLQVMQDEFDCNVEDDSEEEVARNILALRKRVFEDLDLSALSELETRWKNRGQIKTNIQIIDGEVEGEEDEEWDGFEEDEDGDVNMAAAEEIVPDLVPVLKKERPEPEVDEDGFTKVVGKKKR
jgi:pre-rRNA-processing protein TSR2